MIFIYLICPFTLFSAYSCYFLLKIRYLLIFKLIIKSFMSDNQGEYMYSQEGDHRVSGLDDHHKGLIASR